MVFLLNTNRDGVCSANGELSYRIYEKEVDNEVKAIVYLVLSIDKLYTDINRVKCDLGVFEHTHLISISGGSKDNYITYELESGEFSFNVENIEKMLNREG